MSNGPVYNVNIGHGPYGPPPGPPPQGPYGPPPPQEPSNAWSMSTWCFAFGIGSAVWCAVTTAAIYFLASGGDPEQGTALFGFSGCVGCFGLTGISVILGILGLTDSRNPSFGHRFMLSALGVGITWGSVLGQLALVASVTTSAVEGRLVGVWVGEELELEFREDGDLVLRDDARDYVARYSVSGATKLEVRDEGDYESVYEMEFDGGALRLSPREMPPRNKDSAPEITGLFRRMGDASNGSSEIALKLRKLQDAQGKVERKREQLEATRDEFQQDLDDLKFQLEELGVRSARDVRSPAQRQIANELIDLQRQIKRIDAQLQKLRTSAGRMSSLARQLERQVRLERAGLTDESTEAANEVDALVVDIEDQLGVGDDADAVQQFQDDQLLRDLLNE